MILSNSKFTIRRALQVLARRISAFIAPATIAAPTFPILPIISPEILSGIAYTQPDNFAKAFAPAEREKVWQRYIDWTKRYMPRLDLHTLRTVGGSDENLIRYGKAIPLASILGDMGRYSGREGIANLTYSLSPQLVGGEGVPVFRTVTSWRYGQDGFLKEVRDQIGTQRPAFVNGFVHAWTWNSTSDIAKIYAARDKDMVFVTPTQLAALYREAARQSWAKYLEVARALLLQVLAGT